MQPVLRTVLPAIEYDFRIDYRKPMAALGSCFAEHIGRRLQARKFDLLLNPFGILYNPAIIADNLTRLTRSDVPPFGKEDLVEREGLWFSWAHHGRFADTDPQRLLDRLNREAEATRTALAQARLVMITLGTARVFRSKATGHIVANCHKAPAHTFEHCLLALNEVECQLARIVAALRQLSRVPDQLELLWSVSPVRHLRDGLVGNQLSKATLLLATHRQVQQDPHSHYFPAYELVLDDLRDYRFTQADMVHPNELAQEYVWQWFCDALLESHTRTLMQEIEQIAAATSHRPIHPGSPPHRKFVAATRARIESLRHRYPWLDFSKEIESLQQYC